jgi:hypothetical protein
MVGTCASSSSVTSCRSSKVRALSVNKVTILRQKNTGQFGGYYISMLMGGVGVTASTYGLDHGSTKMGSSSGRPAGIILGHARTFIKVN